MRGIWTTLAVLTLIGCGTMEPDHVLPARPAAREIPLTIPSNRRVQIAGDQFYLDGVRLLVKATFYDYHPIGVNPWETQPPEDVLRRQIRDLKAAGFNTMRSFHFTPRTLAICRDEGMLVLIQFWIDGEGDFSDAAFRRGNVARIRALARQFAPFDNILGWLVTNEPQLHNADSQAEIDETLAHLVELRDAVKEESPGAYVSFADWPALVFLDHTMWDFIAFNVYTWGPATTTKHGMGYRPFLDHVKKAHACDRPLIVTEYGVSVSPADESGHGYGGWSEAGQADESIRMLGDILAAGAAGGTYTHFADQIWKMGSNREQDDHPEEWFGMYALDPEGGPAMEGRWRPVYHAHRDFYRSVVIEPAPASVIRGRQRVLVHAEHATAVQFSIAGGPEQALEKSAGPWWVGHLDTTDLPDGVATIVVTAEGPWGEPEHRSVCVSAANASPDPLTLFVSVTPARRQVQPGDVLPVSIRVTRADGTPASGFQMHWVVHEHWRWDIEPRLATTGPDGRVEVEIRTDTRAGAITISAGVEVGEGLCARRFGDLAVVRVGM